MNYCLHISTIIPFNQRLTQCHVIKVEVLLDYFYFDDCLSCATLVSADSDGDGVADATDDCVWSSGTSTTDRVGCPDRDGDGISDFNDGWSANNPNFQNEFTISSNQDYNDVDFSGDDELIVTGDEDGWARIWNATTHVNVGQFKQSMVVRRDICCIFS